MALGPFSLSRLSSSTAVSLVTAFHLVGFWLSFSLVFPVFSQALQHGSWVGAKKNNVAA